MPQSNSAAGSCVAEFSARPDGSRSDDSLVAAH